MDIKIGKKALKKLEKWNKDRDRMAPGMAHFCPWYNQNDIPGPFETKYFCNKVCIPLFPKTVIKNLDPVEYDCPTTMYAYKTVSSRMNNLIKVSKSAAFVSHITIF